MRSNLYGIGCGIARFDDREIAPLFADAVGEENIVLPETFVRYLNSRRSI